MPKQFSPEIKEKALALYMKGDKSAREITEVLWDAFATEVKASTIYLWAREGDWDTQQKSIRTEAIEKIKAKRLGEHKAKWSREEQKELDEMMIRSVDSELRVDYA